MPHESKKTAQRASRRLRNRHPAYSVSMAPIRMSAPHHPVLVQAAAVLLLGQRLARLQALGNALPRRDGDAGLQHLQSRHAALLEQADEATALGFVHGSSLIGA